MTTIFCLTKWDSDMNLMGNKLFMTIEGVTKYLTEQKPIDNKIKVTDRDIAGDYDITADNLRYIFNETKKHGSHYAPRFSFEQDFVLYTAKTEFGLSTIEVED